MEKCARCGATDELLRVIYVDDESESEKLCEECALLWKCQALGNSDSYFSIINATRDW